MAEYSEVIKQFKRMCRYTNHSGLPNECPLYCKGHGCNISHCRLLAFEDKKFQNVVMSWAAEHPEPVYPAWRDWLRDLYGNPNMTMTDILESPIDPEIARRLNIVPRRTI